MAERPDGKLDQNWRSRWFVPGPVLVPLGGSSVAVLDGVGRRHRSELLARLLLTLVGLGLLSGLVQLAAVPDFLSTFLAMTVALAFLAGAYAISRTPAYRIAAVIACIAPTVACLAVVVQNPDDRIALSFMLLSVVFATTFLSTCGACVMAAIVLTAVGLATILVPPLRSPERWIPVTAFHGIMSALLVLAAKQRNRIEAEQDRRVQDAEARLGSAETRTREVETQLLAAQRFATVGRLSAGVGHDLNNLLALLLNAHQGLDAKDERVAEVLRQVEAAGAMAKKLVSQMITLARSGGETGAQEPVDVNAVLRQAGALLSCAAGGHCELSIRCADRPLLVRIDPLDLQRILLNLAANGGKAMPTGGTLRIEVFGPHDRRVAAIAITDSGKGMDRDMIARSFEPFVSTRSAEGGFGLGLSIVADLLRRHGGHLEVWSEPGRGSRFTLLLPLCSE
jgi:signal transduction histidine kinase